MFVLACVAVLRKESLHETPCFAVFTRSAENEKSGWLMVQNEKYANLC
jgi:hypothetical protein